MSGNYIKHAVPLTAGQFEKIKRTITGNTVDLNKKGKLPIQVFN